PHHRVMDLIYRPERTLFLEQCAARGAHVLGGWTMLELQAIASLEFWLA
ncbi:MAG: shikimate dehydrogenase, partial [Sphingobacteriia bacterium]|nr:shikimate dehydrogenase [Sphingobacteriia bacterium]